MDAASGGDGADYIPPMSSDPQLPTRGPGLLREFVDFVRHEKIWWMAPLLVALVVVAGLVAFAETSPILPFIYAL